MNTYLKQRLLTPFPLRLPIPLGDAIPRRLPIPLGDARHDSFFRVWFGSKFLQKMREREKYVKTCGTCEKANVCGGCRALAYAITGDAFAPDPSCWLF